MGGVFRMKRRTLIDNNSPNLRNNSIKHERSEITTFDDAVRLFMAENIRKGLAVDTNEFYKGNLALFKRFHIDVKDSLPPMALNYALIDAFIEYRTITLGKSLNATNIPLRALKRYCTFLTEQGLADDNPFDHITITKTKSVDIQTFTDVDIAKLLSCCDLDTFVGYRDYVMMSFMLDTGIRLRELCDLTVDDVHLAEDYIRVFGKNQEYRNIPLGKALKKLVKAYLSVRGYSPSNHLFISQNDTPLKRRSVQSRLRKYGNQAGISAARVSPHTFRHTFAKMYIRNGGNIFVLQDILGHSTLEMVRVYVRLYSPDLYRDHSKHSPLGRINGV